MQLYSFKDLNGRQVHLVSTQVVSMIEIDGGFEIFMTSGPSVKVRESTRDFIKENIITDATKIRFSKQTSLEVKQTSLEVNIKSSPEVDVNIVGPLNKEEHLLVRRVRD